MKTRKHYFFIGVFLLSITSISAQNLKPYVLGAETADALDKVKPDLIGNLAQEGLNVLGSYSPANDPDRWVVIVSSDGLVSAVKSVGGLAGFGAALRIGLIYEGGKTLISYTNPAYWGNAYFRSDYPAVEQYFTSFNASIESVMKKTGQFSGKDFGSEKGISIDDLRKYRYMFGMPRFEDPVDLNKFSDYDDAVTKIDANIAAGVENVTLVYALEIPNERLKLYGFALGGEGGESAFVPKIDIADPKHTAFLPYEMLVMDGRVVMLHGRFRIALSFPDLTMGTFTKIMSTPGDIKDMLEAVTE